MKKAARRRLDVSLEWRITDLNRCSMESPMVTDDGGARMYDETQLYMPQDVRLCGVCKQWVELGEFRRRTGGGIAHECRECHNQQRAAQLRRQRARRRKKDFQTAIAEVNQAEAPSDLHAAATALLGISGGLRGFAQKFASQFNAAKPGSQMRTSMLLAGVRILVQYAQEREEQTDRELESMSDEDLRRTLAETLLGN
jgi:hypothetical protein